MTARKRPIAEHGLPDHATVLPPDLRHLPPWRAITLDLRCQNYAEGAEQLFDLTIDPSCSAIASMLSVLPRKGTHAEMDQWEDLRTLQIVTHQSFTISLGALWERTFRDHLLQSAWIIVPKTSASLSKAITNSKWVDMCGAFERVRGFPLMALPMYSDLRVLYLATSAIRHGNGHSVDELYALRPDLFLNDGVRSGWPAYFSEGGDREHDIKRLDIPLHQIRAFVDAVAGFWRLIDALRLYHGRRED
jgi:hypothetical protein